MGRVAGISYEVQVELRLLLRDRLQRAKGLFSIEPLLAVDGLSVSHWSQAANA